MDNKKITTKKNRNEKKSLFWRIYWIYTIALALVIVSLLIVLWNFLASYEKSRPVHAMEEAVELIKEEQFEALEAYVTLGDNPYIDGNEVVKFAFKKMNGDNLDYGKLSGKYTENHPVYAVTVDGETVASLSFKESEEETGFGFHKWELTEISPMVTGNVSVMISVPEGLKTLVNGKELQDLDFEKEITGFLEEPQVLIEDKYGNTLELASDGNGHFTYAYGIAEVPMDATLYVDGEAIDESNLLGQERPDIFSFWDDLEKSYPEYSSLADRVTIPTIKKYNLDFICSQDMLSAKNDAGVTYSFSYDQASNVYVTTWSKDETEKEVCKQFAFDFMTAYTKYVSGEGYASGMSPYFISGSSYYRKLSKMDNQWFPSHSGSSYINYECEEFTSYSDSLAFIKVSMDQNLVYNYTGQAATIHVEMPIWLMKVDGKWSIAMIDYENYKSE